jgi:dinitrogenase reductase activationg glycohydrolase
VIRLAQVSARETHYSYEAEAAAEVFAAILHNATHLKNKADIIDVSKYSTGAHYDQLLNKLKERAETDKLKNKPGYVVYTLQIALWGFMSYDTFEDGMLAVMCLGGDVDTTMAVYGQLAGAYYGLNAIPNEWRRDVYQGNDIIELADKLAAMDDCPVLYTRFEEDVT